MLLMEILTKFLEEQIQKDGWILTNKGYIHEDWLNGSWEGQKLLTKNQILEKVLKNNLIIK